MRYWHAAVFVIAILAVAAIASASQYQVLYSGQLPAATITAMTADAAGNVYLTGNTNSAAFPVTPDAFQTAFGGGACISIPIGPGLGPTAFPCPDAFVMKLSPTGTLIYSSFLGGNGSDQANSIAVDAQGNAYVAGTTQPNSASNTFPVTASAPTTQASGFLVKINPQGTAIVYSWLFPGAAGGTAGAAVDSTGAAYFVGSSDTGHTTFATTSAALQPTPSALSLEPVVVKLNPAGSAIVYATYLDGAPTRYQDTGLSIAADAQGNAYVSGVTTSQNFPATPGVLQSATPDVAGSGFVAKLNPLGTALSYATYLGGSLFNQVSAVRIDALGNAHLFGATEATDFPVTSSAIESTPSPAAWHVNNFKAAVPFVASLNAQASALNFSTYFDGAMAMDVDAAGNSYVAGIAARGFPVSDGAYQRCLAGGGQDIFVAQLNADGSLAAGTYVGGPGWDYPYAIAAVPGSAGTVYLAGFFGGLVNGQALSAPGTVTVARLQINDPQATPSPCSAQAIENGASFVEGAIAPGEMITIRGDRFGPLTGSVVPANQAPPSQLGGVQVTFNGVPAPLLYVQSKQINAIVPWEVAGLSSVNVAVQYGGASAGTFPVSVTTASPAVFLEGYTGPQGAILNPDGSLNSPSNPAPRGSVVAIFGTGGGAMSPAGATGQLWPLAPLAQLALPVTAQITGGEAGYALVVYAGAAPGLVSGFFQINVQIPMTSPIGSDQLLLTIGGLAASNASVTVAVK